MSTARFARLGGPVIAAAIARASPLSAAEERDLAARIAGGDLAAVDRLVVANLVLVARVAARYRRRACHRMDEVISDGTIGLFDAARRFDPDRGRFADYARRTIGRRIRLGIEESLTPIHLPYHARRLLRAWRRAAGRIEAATGMTPSDAEVASAMGFTPGVLDRLRAARAARFVPSGWDEAEADDVGVLESLVAAPEVASLAELAEEAARVRTLVASLTAALPDRERAVIRARFGLDGAAPALPREIAASLGITRWGARKAERRALERMRRIAGLPPD